jgi:hypothetical protein
MAGNQMRNPWQKKNPFMSMWLSGANSMFGAARSRAMAEGRRQAAVTASEAQKQIIRFWTTDMFGSPKRKRKKSR